MQVPSQSNAAAILVFNRPLSSVDSAGEARVVRRAGPHGGWSAATVRPSRRTVRAVAAGPHGGWCAAPAGPHGGW